MGLGYLIRTLSHDNMRHAMNRLFSTTLQTLRCWAVLLLAACPASLGKPTEAARDGATAAEKTVDVDGGGAILVPVGAEDRLDYKIENDDGRFLREGFWASQYVSSMFYWGVILDGVILLAIIT